MYFKFDKTNVRILGSMHRLPVEHPDIPLWVNDAYSWCEDLYIEHDALALRPLIFRKDGGSLRSDLPEDLWSSLQSVWPVGGSTLPIDSFKPWMVMLAVTARLQQAVDGVEPLLMRLSAGENPRPLHYLETAAEAASQFDSVPISELQISLSKMLSDRDLPRRTLSEIHQAWVTGDRALLAEVAAKLPMNALPKTRAALLEQRNQNWATTVKRLLSTERRTLICVGALHLCGENNLLDLVGSTFIPLAR